ncbi:hypothetical protein GGS20DRAFT_416780 [Poronia punctata]|nr:hypothetical protein GGS20DRAFT_416780 [Poronia punctata]
MQIFFFFLALLRLCTYITNLGKVGGFLRDFVLLTRKGRNNNNVHVVCVINTIEVVALQDKGNPSQRLGYRDIQHYHSMNASSLLMNPSVYLV